MPGGGNWREFQPIGLGSELESRVSQGVHCNHVAGLEQGHGGYRQPMLCTAHEQRGFGRCGQTPAGQVARHRRPLVLAPAVGLVSKQGLQVTCGRELAQRFPEKVCLTRQRGIVEAQVHRVSAPSLQINALTARERLLDERAAAGFAAHQSHDLQLRVDTRGRDQRQSFACREIAVRWQSQPGTQAPRTDVGRETVDQLFVAGLRHV